MSSAVSTPTISTALNGQMFGPPLAIAILTLQ